ncbi:MAG: hypothetical protein FWE20_10425 [Defluviitaleaceae bacterium]|nr:hypothetical protein [Defluviitaleaceae bacterium]
MKKYIASILAFVLLLGLNPNTEIVLANNNQQTIRIEGDASVENVPGITSRFGTSGRILTGTYSHSLFLTLGGVFVGGMTTQAWWEVDTNRNLRGFGHQQMRVTSGPMSVRTPTIHIYVSRMPQPSVAWLGFQGDFLTLFESHTILHDFHMYNHGNYSFRRR